MSSVNLSRFQFSGGENAAPIENLAALPREDQERLVLAGIDVNDSTASGWMPYTVTYGGIKFPCNHISSYRNGQFIFLCGF